MNQTPSNDTHRRTDLLWILLFSAAIVGFALTAHRDAWRWWRWGCLALGGLGLGVSWYRLEQPFRTVFGRARLSRLGVRVGIVAGLGVLAAVGYRALLEESLFPSALHWFVLVAMAVGSMEELLWRGWMQGTLSSECRLGPAPAILFASASHTAYKTSLFLFPPAGVPAQTPWGLFLIAGLTFVFGSLLGWFRVRQGTIAGPIAFHATFDLFVYGSYASPPWWVF